MKLRVNGQPATLDIPDDVPLLWAIREELGLTGTKFGCGAAQCGACTVLVDGVAARACVIPAGGVAGRAITTLEGLAQEGMLHPVQRAFIAEEAAQCGYCLNGMIMTTVALLARRPQPTDAEIRAEFARSLCRCGAHVEILRAVHHAAALVAHEAK